MKSRRTAGSIRRDGNDQVSRTLNNQMNENRWPLPIIRIIIISFRCYLFNFSTITHTHTYTRARAISDIVFSFPLRERRSEALWVQHATWAVRTRARNGPRPVLLPPRAFELGRTELHDGGAVYTAVYDTHTRARAREPNDTQNVNTGCIVPLRTVRGINRDYRTNVFPKTWSLLWFHFERIRSSIYI